MKEQLDRIEAKLDKVIKAMQEYDGLDEDFKEPQDEYGKYKTSPCVGHDAASWEEEMNERIDIIGQNGNEGLHYDREKVIKASKEFGKKKAAEVREQLKGATLPKSKKKYYKPKKKKNETL